MSNQLKKSDKLKIMLAAPRGFCAGVDRAVQIVERALEKYGRPVYVRHEIVHNKYVVDKLREKGAVFVDELEDIPPNDRQERPVIFSAHGVPKSVPAAAADQNMFFLDATCPLVSKVHREAERHYKQGRQIILIGHKGHPEVIGTMGQLPEGAVILLERKEDIDALKVEDEANLAYCTQTTLSLDDTASIVEALKKRFPSIVAPGKEDICYATTNRQMAVKAMAPHVDAVMVIGAPNSSNSQRLVEVAAANGCDKAMLIAGAQDIQMDWLAHIDALGITAGASAPEELVEGVIDHLSQYFEVSVQEISIANENVTFNIPKILRGDTI